MHAKLDVENTCKTRSKGGYIPFKYKWNKFNNSFFPSTVKLWNSLPKTIQHKHLIEFKLCTKQELKPPRYNISLGDQNLATPYLPKLGLEDQA
jgi:hypothetical protein